MGRLEVQGKQGRKEPGGQGAKQEGGEDNQHSYPPIEPATLRPHPLSPRKGVEQENPPLHTDMLLILKSLSVL